MKKHAILYLLTAAVIFCSAVLPHAVLNVRADDTDYGEAAYEYLRTITDRFPSRVNNKAVQESQEAKAACGEWIDATMKGFGYTSHIIDGDINRPENEGNPVRSYCYFKQGHSSKKIVVGAHFDSVQTKGSEDNGTGVSVLLELAKRFSDVTTPLSLEFCFWDGEEYLNKAGSFSYYAEQLGNGKINDILLYINLDCVGAGDYLYVYGGVYENDRLTKDWGYNMTLAVADDLGIEVRSLPEGLSDNYRSPTRLIGSDHLFFIHAGIPYIYFETTCIVDEEGNVVNPDAPCRFHTADPRVVKTETSIRGRIIHSVFDDLDKLEELFPGRIKTHMAETSEIVTRILKTAAENSPAVYEGNHNAEPPVEPPTTAPTVAPTTAPTTAPTEAPTTAPTVAPTTAPTVSPTAAPTEGSDFTKAPASSEEAPSGSPSENHSDSPTGEQTPDPTKSPDAPSATVPRDSEQTDAPTETPSDPGSGARPITAAEIIVIVIVLALWGVWAYIYLKYYR